MTYFWTLIPFLFFLVFILRHEIRHKKRELSQKIETDRYMRPIARSTNRMFEKQYGQSSPEIQTAFPDIKNGK